MTTRALAIRNAVVALISAPPIAGVVTVQVDIDHAIATGQLPAVVVELGDEPSPDRVVTGSVDCTLELSVTVLTKGSDPVAAAEPIRAEIHQRMTADLTLGGLAMDVVFSGTRRDRDSAETRLAMVATTWRIDYRRPEQSLD